MPGRLARLALLAALLAPTAAAAQQPAPAASPTGSPTASPGRTPERQAPRPAPPRPPGQAASPPRAQPPKPRPQQRPAGRPAARPAVPPVVAPVPVPAPAAEPEKPAEPAKGSVTGAPLPRFAALRSDEVNLRTGPGTRYPIEWLYKRRDLPVQIEREFEAWRLIRDQEGVKGWVNQAVLVPRRTGVVTGAEAVLHRDAAADSTAVARLKPGVILRVRSCEAAADWCQASIQDYRGWIKRSDFWGTLPGEAVQ